MCTGPRCHLSAAARQLGIGGAADERSYHTEHESGAQDQNEGTVSHDDSYMDIGYGMRGRADAAPRTESLGDEVHDETWELLRTTGIPP